MTYLGKLLFDLIQIFLANFKLILYVTTQQRLILVLLSKSVTLYFVIRQISF